MTENYKDKMFEELKTAGYTYKDVNDIYKQKLPAKVVEIILKWLPKIYQEHIGSGEQLTRSLISAQEPFDPSVLINLFENSNYNKQLKWTMAYVLAISKTYDISGWMMNQLLDKESSFERDGLISGLTIKAGINDKKELTSVLKKLFDKYCYFEDYLKLFQKYADKEDISFLEEKIKNPNIKDFLNYVKAADSALGENKAKNALKRFEKDILKVIEGIKKRKKENRFPITSKTKS